MFVGKEKSRELFIKHNPKFESGDERYFRLHGKHKEEIKKISSLQNAEEKKLLDKIKKKHARFYLTDCYSNAIDRARELVRARDDWKCRQCGIEWSVGQRKLDVHHLDDKMDGKSKTPMIHRYDLENQDKLITLCHKCHFNLDITRLKIMYAMENRAVDN